MYPNQPNDTADNGGNPDPAAGAAGGNESLLNPPAGAQPGANDWMPEKFRVNNDAGEFDEAASSRKLADSYRALEAHKGPAMKAPETVEGYKLTAPLGEDGKPIEGIDIDAFMADPMFQGIAKDAHAAGIPNEHMQFFMEKYLRTAPELFNADKRLTVDEASKELSALWGNEEAFKGNLGKANRVVNEFSNGVAEDQPGSFARLNDKFGTDPDFMAFAARVGNELKFDEDRPASGASTAADMDIDAMMKGEAYWNPNHAEHAKVKQKVAEHYARKHGTAVHR